MSSNLLKQEKKTDLSCVTIEERSSWIFRCLSVWSTESKRKRKEKNLTQLLHPSLQSTLTVCLHWSNEWVNGLLLSNSFSFPFKRSIRITARIQWTFSSSGDSTDNPSRLFRIKDWARHGFQYNNAFRHQKERIRRRKEKETAQTKTARKWNNDLEVVY